MAAPAAGFNIFAGPSGDFLSAQVTIDGSVDVITLPGTPPTPTAVVEATRWDIKPSLTPVTFSGFRSESDGYGSIYDTPLRGGKAKWSVSITLAVNANSAAGASTYARFPLGSYVYFHLLYHKSQGYGFRGCFGKVLGNGSGADHESQKADMMTLEIDGIGALPPPTFGP